MAFFDDFNEDEEILLDFDQDWIYEEGRIYYCSIAFVLYCLGFYLLTFLYLIGGITLIWDITEEDEGDEIIANYEIDFKSYWGISVEWETLIDYIQSINLEPNLTEEDLEDLEVFYISLDKLNRDNEQYIVLLDYIMSQSAMISSYSSNLKMIQLRNIDFESFEVDIKERDHDFAKMESDISKENYDILKKNPKLARNMSFVEDIQSRRKLVRHWTEMNILDRHFHHKMIIRNKTAVGNSFNHGFYPVSDYDCDRAIVLINEELSFFEYPLFSYNNFNDLNIEGLDQSLIEYKIKI